MSTSGCRKPRFLCLHSFRSSAAIFKSEVFGTWPELVTSRLDLVFVNAPFPTEGTNDPPTYEWFQANADFSQYINFDECLEYIEEVMIKEGPFDGLMGFSQGGFLAAGLPGLQAKGLALTRVPKVKYVIIISGGKFTPPALEAAAYSKKIKKPSLHFIGDLDINFRVPGEELLKEFVHPFVFRHPEGHTVPKLDDEGLPVVLAFLKKIEKDLHEDAVLDDDELTESL